jgi:excinuclease ABC subunit A
VSRASSNTIRIRGAKEHNLKSLAVDVPRDSMVVVTGVSGSGKSSLAFDTIFAEGQRKYMESLSAYARQFLDVLQKPDVESIEGLPPTIAIQQRSGGHNPRSTVATTTEIYDYLRLLYARCGEPRCWHPMGRAGGETRVCGRPIEASSATQIVNALMQSDEGTRIMVCAPLIRGKKGFHRDVLEGLRKQGFVRARVDGEIADVREALKEGGENPLGLGRYEQHTIEAIVDRIAIREDVRSRLADSVEVALRLGDGAIVVLSEQPGDTWSERHFSERFACPEHPQCSLDELEPRLFSFNSPYGACPQCDGLGVISEFDPSLVVPDASVTLGDGAVEPWRKNGRRMNIYYSRMLRRFCEAMGVSKTTAFEKLPRAVRRMLIHGTSESDETRHGFVFEGVIPNLHRRYETTDSDFVKERLRHYMSNAPCPECGGARLRTESRHVMLRQGSMALSITDATSLTIDQAIGFFDRLDLSEEHARIAEPILREITARLGFLASVGLNYLSLDRTSSTLSGGEAQRIRLATQVGSGLVGVCYVLDEPTIGLHQRDNDRLIDTLRSLTDIGNTVARSSPRAPRRISSRHRSRSQARSSRGSGPSPPPRSDAPSIRTTRSS